MWILHKNVDETSTTKFPLSKLQERSPPSFLACVMCVYVEHYVDPFATDKLSFRLSIVRDLQSSGPFLLSFVLSMMCPFIQAKYYSFTYSRAAGAVSGVVSVCVWRVHKWVQEKKNTHEIKMIKST
jgi:hypothetical protein